VTRIGYCLAPKASTPEVVVLQGQPSVYAKEIALTAVGRRDIDWSIGRMDGRTKLFPEREDLPAPEQAQRCR